MEAESRPKSLRITLETKRLNSLPQRLITPGSVRLGDRCNDWEQASHNGELVHAVEAGVLTRDDVSQLGDVLIGTAEGRTSEGDITIFDSTGLAIQDLAVALAAMERADELDLQIIDLQR
jgi:ornithine cyclodeaminase/mu-crystallin family protein